MYQTALQTKQIRIGIAVFVAIIVFITVLFVLLKTDNFSLEELSVRYDNATTQLKGDSLYVFNGDSFFSISTKNNQPPHIYSSGKRLPKPSNIAWANEKGALLSFSGSFVHTPILNKITNGDITYDQATKSTWYYNFSTQQLSLVSNTELASSESFYDAGSQKIYYFQSDTDSGLMSLHTYNIDTKKDSAIPNANSFFNVSGANTCPASKSGTFCFTASQSSNSDTASIFRVSKSDSISAILTVKGEIVPTGRPSTYLILNASSLDTNVAGGDDSGVLTYQKEILYNIDKNKKVAIERGLASSNILVTSYNTVDAALFATGDNLYTVTNRTLFGQRTSDKSVDMKQAVIDAQPGDGILLIHGTSDLSYQFSRMGSPQDYLTPQNLDNNIKQCYGNNSINSDSPKSVTFYINDDSSFDKTVASISSCLNKTPEIQTNYTVEFASINPESKRITSD